MRFTKTSLIKSIFRDDMSQLCLFLLTLLLAWNLSDSYDHTCNTIWRYKTNVYQPGAQYGGGKPNIPTIESCLATCSRAFPNCTGCEVRNGNCWIHTKPIRASLLQTYGGTMQYFLVQKCNPELCSSHWLEVDTNSASHSYPDAYPLSTADKSHRTKCLNLCASTSPCVRLFFCPTTEGDLEPYGSSCSLKKTLQGSTPQGCIEYRLFDECL